MISSFHLPSQKTTTKIAILLFEQNIYSIKVLDLRLSGTYRKNVST